LLDNKLLYLLCQKQEIGDETINKIKVNTEPE